jgi:hypothetical protein
MMNGVRRAAMQLLVAASRLLPPRLAAWTRAMMRELDEIPGNAGALVFALGYLRAILSLAIAERLRPLCAAPPVLFPERSIQTMNGISARPRLLGLLCAACAVGLGIAYMAAAGAPPRYLLVNLMALVIGATAWLMLGRTAGSRLGGAGAMVLSLGIVLLLTALFGISAEGATRWVRVGPLPLQVSLIVLPLMLVAYARRPDAIGTAGMAVAALALAVQPDRAMAGVLAAGLIALLASRPGRHAVAAAAASVAAFGWTLLTPDRLPASPYVDQIFYTAFQVHPLAGVAVVLGAAALLVPAIGAWRLAGERPALLAFGGCWAGVIVAAALGNNPTPLVGYGGSAVLGYLLSVALLPGGKAAQAARGADAPMPEGERSSDPGALELCAVRSA